jgi:hypothetical protein
MSASLLIETLYASEANMMVESSQDGKNMWLNGVFMQADIKNRNGRTYPKSIMSEAVRQLQSAILESNGVFGELDHPTTLTINLDRISHVISEVQFVGNNVIGKAKLLNTPMGLIAQELSKSGAKLGVSSRGAGNVMPDGTVSEFQVITVDVVAQPSAPGATPMVVYEGIERARNGTQIMSLAESLVHDESAQKYFKREIIKFFEEFSRKK